MAAANSPSTMTGFFKEIYGDDVLSLAPFKARLMKRFKFREAASVGNKYHQPLRLSSEHGITYAASGSQPTLEAATAAVMGDAQVDGSQLFARAQIDYEAMFRAFSKNDKKAFGESTAEVVKNLAEAVVKRIEAQILWGQQGIGTVLSQTGSGTTRAIVLSAATWSAGMWANEEGASFDVYDTTLVTKQNTNAAVVLVSVDPITRTLNVSGNATDLDAIVATTVFFWRTASALTEFCGLNKILGTTSGTQFNISATTNSLWRGNQYAVGSVAPTMRKILAGISLAASYGLEEDLLLVASPSQFEDLNEDLAALRMFDSSYVSARGETGVEAIKYHSQTGSVEIMAHPLQMNGYMHAVPVSQVFRLGATDATFVKRGGGQHEELIIDSSTQGIAEMRMYSHQALFMQRPRWGIQYTGVTP